MKLAFLISCEHAFNTIPEEFENISIPEAIISSHYSYDKGAYFFSKFLYQSLDTKRKLFLYSKINRLLIDYNRSLNNPKVFSKFSKNLTEEQKKILIKDYKIFREQSYRFIFQSIQLGYLVIHFSIHSFAYFFRNRYRKTEIGILYDPRKSLEVKFAKELKKALNQYKCHLNLPYRGYTDGHTTHLRQMFREKYIGIELEINQKYVIKNQFEKTIQIDIGKAINSLIKLY